VGGVGEALEDCGLLVPPRSPILLGEAVVSMLRDEQLRAEMGRRARQRVIRQFHVAGTVDAHVAMYQELRERKARRKTG
jgi:glycosyltransferase involved in cell wall biosynthesis